MKKAIIYKPSKSVMQSGYGNTKQWKLAFSTDTDDTREDVMDWVSTENTMYEIVLFFDSLEEAITYTKKHEMSYHVVALSLEAKKSKNEYIFNFTKNRNLYYY